jgi:hypothetical protein
MSTLDVAVDLTMQQQTQELAGAAFLSAHAGGRFETLVGAGTDLATARNGVARARRTVVHFSSIRFTSVTRNCRMSHPVAAAALIITPFSFFSK